MERARTRRGDDGSTLIELLIVVILLGVLATVVLLHVGGLTDRGGASACEHDKRAIAAAVEVYRTRNGDVTPSSLSQLTQGNQYLRASPGITATSSSGRGYTLTYDPSTGTTTDCATALQAG